MADHKRLPLIQPWWLILPPVFLIACLVIVTLDGIWGSGFDGWNLLTLAGSACSLVFSLISIRWSYRNQARGDD